MHEFVKHTDADMFSGNTLDINNQRPTTSDMTKVLMDSLVERAQIILVAPA